MFRTAISAARTASGAAFVNARSLHSTPVAFKTVTDSVKEKADELNKKVGKGLASTIESGEQATESVKQSLGSTTETAKEKTKETSHVAGQKSNQAAAGAKQAKEDFVNEVKK